MSQPKKNITNKADPESIRVDGHGSAVIHDVQFQCKSALPEEALSPKAKELEQERKKLQTEKETIEDRQNVLKRRVEVLDEIVAKVGESVVHRPAGEQSASFVLNDESLQNLTKFFSFYEDSSVDMRKKLREVNEEHRIVDEKLTKLAAEIGALQHDERYARHVSVLLESAEGGDVELDVSYQVSGATWQPSYDIRVDEKTSEDESTLKLIYYGKIGQNTGEEWVDAPLVLSTAQPSLGGNLPKFGTQVAYLYKPAPELPPAPPRPAPFGAVMKQQHLAVRSANDAMEHGALFGTPPAMAYAAVNVAPVSTGDTVLSTVFVIARPATIPSDSSEHKVTIATMEMKPTMIHETIPSKNTNVFLTASVLNSSQFPFLPGQANVYLNNSFVAKSHIKAVSPNERFVCSLGVDPGIKLEYKPLHKFSEQIGLLTKSASIVNEQRIVIKNTKKEKILLTLREHVPKSTDDKIKIKLFSPEIDQKVANSTAAPNKGELPPIGARLDSSHNLEWTMNIEPSTESEVVVKWTVEHPNGETVAYREEF
ncbi:unnamed protein product [Anisakis simplex]|uniref:DUF4139 domain-containing protein n=1 Tax=Anisakis simplex TaxID=6269 RepID=A0A0M3K8A1_ANISI|nr:unnamed protein product [Anisakis simplex]